MTSVVINTSLAELNRRYRDIHVLWVKYGEAEYAHECPDEDFHVCAICRASQEAQDSLELQCLSTIVPLVERYHDLLEELVREVVLTVPFGERSPELQQAMLRGLSAVGDLSGGK